MSQVDKIVRRNTWIETTYLSILAIAFSSWSWNVGRPILWNDNSFESSITVYWLYDWDPLLSCWIQSLNTPQLVLKAYFNSKVWGDSFSEKYSSSCRVFMWLSQLAAVAALCVQYEADFRPNMTIVVKALQPLLNSKPAGLDSNA